MFPVRLLVPFERMLESIRHLFMHRLTEGRDVREERPLEVLEDFVGPPTRSDIIDILPGEDATGEDLIPNPVRERLGV